MIKILSSFSGKDNTRKNFKSLIFLIKIKNYLLRFDGAHFKIL